jgi:hypothetical protein
MLSLVRWPRSRPGFLRGNLGVASVRVNPGWQGAPFLARSVREKWEFSIRSTRRIHLFTLQ